MRLLIALIMMAIFLGSGSSQAAEAANPAATPPTATETLAGGPLAGSGKSGIDMPSLMAPVTVNGELRYYVYLAIRLNLSSDSQKDLVLERIPYIQDAFLREVHRSSVALGDDAETVDAHALSERLITVAAKVLGPGVVTGIEFRNIVRRGS
jgi:hypothetical protein